METLYRIVFNGETLPGLTTEQIIEAFVKRFRVREQRAREIILGGSRTVLKRGLDQTKAQRYSAALKKVGLLIVLEPQPESPPPTSQLSVDLTPSIDLGHSELASYYDDTPASLPVSAPASGLVADWARCPKCRQPAVSPVTGVCQACGVVVERYLARRAEQANGADAAHGDNPYAPPAADLTPPASGWRGAGLRRPRTVSAGRGWGWVRDAWGLFRGRPWAWIGAFLVYLLISIVLNLVPYGLGGLLMIALGPILTGGLMLGAQVQQQGGGFQVAHLFAGFQRNPGSLALVGVATVGFAILLLLAMALLGALAAYLLAGPGFIAGIDHKSFDPSRMGPEGMVFMLLPVLLLLLLFVPLGMATFFAPVLVALNEVPVLRSFTLSFQGCWRNILPFVVFGLVALGLSLTSILTLGLAIVVLAPVLIIATYMAYRDIYCYR